MIFIFLCKLNFQKAGETFTKEMCVNLHITPAGGALILQAKQLQFGLKV